GNANDIQGSNNGTLQNGATFAAGNVGQAFSLDGVNDFIQIPDAPDLTPSSITLDAWVKPTTVSTGADGQVIVSKYNSNNPATNGVSWILLMLNTGKLRFVVYQQSASNSLSDIDARGIDTDAPVLAPAVWHHVASSFDLNTQAIAIYVDGVQVPASPIPGAFSTITAIDDSTTPVRIGAAVNINGQFTGFWEGLIDEVEIFNRALSASEIQAIVHADTAGKCKQAPNSAPVAHAQSVTTNEDNPKTITLTGSDPEGDALNYGITSPPSHGALSGAAPNETYTPSANYYGSDSFNFKVNDGTTDSGERTVLITVSPVNDAPIADAQSVTTNED